MSSTEALKKIVGSLLVVGFDGTRLSDSVKNFLEQWDLGGVILFKRNIESFEQLIELNTEIYRGAGTTPIVSVDHEGGRVFRLPEPFTVFPPMRRLGDYCGREKNWRTAVETGKIFGRELRAAGFNVDYAPVLDVDSNPENPIIGDRAFAAAPETTAQAAIAFWRGLESEGVRGCGKHFPGHGDTVEDSHLTLPKVTKAQADLRACELTPFIDAVREGIPLLMTAHVLYPAFDETWPATLSKQILTGLLREEIGFQGLIISDDFFMKGITAKWPVEEAAERFLRVGGDLVLLCHQEAVQRRVAAHLVHRAERDSDFRRQLAEKSVRIGEFRKQLRRGIESFPGGLPSVAHQKWAQNLRG